MCHFPSVGVKLGSSRATNPVCPVYIRKFYLGASCIRHDQAGNTLWSCIEYDILVELSPRPVLAMSQNTRNSHNERAQSSIGATNSDNKGRNIFSERILKDLTGLRPALTPTIINPHLAGCTSIRFSWANTRRSEIPHYALVSCRDEQFGSFKLLELGRHP